MDIVINKEIIMGETDLTRLSLKLALEKAYFEYYINEEEDLSSVIVRRADDSDTELYLFRTSTGKLIKMEKAPIKE